MLKKITAHWVPWGLSLGRLPETLSPEEIEDIKDKIAHGVTRAEIAMEMGLT
jgi:hypothetical protein